jgi:hypothetical protein
LTAAKQEGVRILPLIIGHCHASLQLSGLAKFQSLNSPENVLSGMDRNDSEKLFAQLVAIIAKIDEPNH